MAGIGRSLPLRVANMAIKITASANYYSDKNCPLADCERLYCAQHRFLFRSCDTARRTVQGDGSVIGGRRYVWESENECPYCADEARIRRISDGRILGGLR